MPIITVHLNPGRSADQKRQLIAELTNGTVRSLGVPAMAIRVVLVEVPAEDWGIGGQTKAEFDKAQGRDRT